MLNLRNLFEKIGRIWLVLLITLLAIILSILITTIVFETIGHGINTLAILTAILAPLLISPSVSWFIVDLLLKFEKRSIDLENALKEIKILKDILPICSYCKNIRDDEGSWKQMESYISSHSDTQFSHGICPDCLVKVRQDTGLNNL